MKRLQLVAPKENHKEMILEYKKDFIESGDSMDGTAGLNKVATFEEWYSALVANSSEETVGEGLVPASTYLGISKETGQLAGMIDIRHRLNDFLSRIGGNIGYSVRPSERKKGYAKEMLALALEACKDLGMDKVLVTCDKVNAASAKTIIANGGVLDKEVDDDTRIVQHYWITLR